MYAYPDAQSCSIVHIHDSGFSVLSLKNTFRNLPLLEKGPKIVDLVETFIKNKISFRINKKDKNNNFRSKENLQIPVDGRSME